MMVGLRLRLKIGGLDSIGITQMISTRQKQYVVSYEAYLVDTVAETARLESDFGSPDQLTLINKTPKRYTVVLNRPANIYNYINFVCNSSETGKNLEFEILSLRKGLLRLLTLRHSQQQYCLMLLKTP